MGEKIAELKLTGPLVRPGARRVKGADASKIRFLRGISPSVFYPPAAKAAAIDGTVNVDLLINEKGYVVEAQVIDESPPGMGFGLAALDATKSYEFENPFNELVLMTLQVQFQP
jgi:TonB family protein